MYTEISASIQEKEDKKNSFYLSVALHIVLLLILLMIPLKKAITHSPELSGIMVDFGNPNAGEDYKQNELLATEVREEIKEENNVEQQQQVAEEKPIKKIENNLVEKESPVLAQKEVIIEKQLQKIEETAIRTNQVTEKSIEDSEVEKIAESKAKFGSLFNKSSTGTIEDKKGDEFGIPNASILEGLSKGTGEAGEGLDSRGLVYEPKIVDKSQKSGIVVIKVCVNNAGNVISSKYTQRGSSTTDSYLINLAEKSARKYKFTPSNVAEQCGTITIDFVVK